MTTVTVAVGTCRAQRLTLSTGERTWTVLGKDHCMVEPAEEYLEYLRAQQASPNTVKSYARALALWWQYLDAFALRWDAVTLEDFGAFLTWLRTGDEPEVTSIERRAARFAESTIATRLAAVISCYDYHVLNGVDVGRDLYRITHCGGSRYKPLLEHIARRKGRRQAVISTTSITSKVLLATSGPHLAARQRDAGSRLLRTKPGTDTHVLPQRNYMTVPVGELRDRQPITPGEFRDR